MTIDLLESRLWPVKATCPVNRPQTQSWQALVTAALLFSFRCAEDGNVGVGAFPKREEILIRSAGFGSIACQRVRAS